MGYLVNQKWMRKYDGLLLAWIIDRMVVDVIMGYRHFKKSMIE